MWAHNVRSIYRVVSRDKFYSGLNIIGLSIGIAVFLISFIVVRFESTYDRWLPDAADIYRIDSVQTFPGQAATTTATGIVATSFTPWSVIRIAVV